ncbi:MAG: monovalent cation/H+ antiporter subunit D family protein [Planctomycetaceae bacterium]|nr:monovalent cation/H+ antiporter subunit D family protein [Planctomycetaceae bacterium]
MSDEIRIQLAIGLPWVAVLWAILFNQRPNLREIGTLGFGLSLFGVIMSLASDVFAGARPEWVAAEILPGFALSFRLEPLGMLFALVASGLWTVTTCYAIGYMRAHHEGHQTRFYACFAIAMNAAMGAAMASNLFTLFVFYELMTLSTYPLVTHHGTEKAMLGGRTYLGILMSTSIAFLMLAIVWTWSKTGTLEFVPGGIFNEIHQQNLIGTTELTILLALFAFGTGKAALMPFHRWLPAAMVAPTPVSALLHAVAVVKVGVFTVMKIAVYTFGIELLHDTGISEWLMYVAGASVLIASLIALTKDNLKARLAYSTISQLSYITLGAALACPAGIIGGSMHIAMHAVGKITLFFCAGAIYVATHKTEISQMRGLGRQMPITMGAFLLGSFSIIGLPPFGGTWSKWYLAEGAAAINQPIFIAVLMISSLLNIAYLLPVAIGGFYLKDAQEPSGVKEAPLMCVLPLCLTAIGGIALFFFADRLYEVLLPIAHSTP